MKEIPKNEGAKVYNRIAAIMLHIPWYSFQGQARLADDTQISRSSISRLLAGVSVPSYPVAAAIAAALDRRLGKHLDVRELFSTDGTYPTPVCALCGCRGCLPAQAYDENDRVTAEFKTARSGAWEQSVAAATHRPPNRNGST